MSCYMCIDSYELPPDSDNWLECPVCMLKPKTWIFNNGECTGCGCGENDYDHFSIHAESVMSFHENDGHTKYYDSDSLRKNWNHWVETGEILWVKDYKNTGRW